MDIVSFVSAALAVLYAYTTLDTRIKLLEQVQAQQTVLDKKQDDAASALKLEIREAFRDLNIKIDRLLYEKKQGS